MKTLVFDFKTIAGGDLILLSYSGPRGGRTHVSYKVMGAHTGVRADDQGRVTDTFEVPCETPAQVAKVLADQINREWLKEAFQARVKEDTGSLVVSCQDMVADCKFSVDVEGGGGTKVSLSEF